MRIIALGGGSALTDIVFPALGRPYRLFTISLGFSTTSDPGYRVLSLILTTAGSVAARYPAANPVPADYTYQITFSAGASVNVVNPNGFTAYSVENLPVRGVYVSPEMRVTLSFSGAFDGDLCTGLVAQLEDLVGNQPTHQP